MTLGRAWSRILPATVLGLTLLSCSCSPSGPTVLTADMPLHLEEHFDVATVVGSEVAADAPALVTSLRCKNANMLPSVPTRPPGRAVTAPTRVAAA